MVVAPLPVLSGVSIALCWWHAGRGRSERVPMLAGVSIFVTAFLGLALSTYPNIIPYDIIIREAAARVSENQVESHHKRAMQILRDAGQAGMSKSEFTRRTQFMDHRSRDGVLRTLAEAGLIETVMLQNKGRPNQWIKVL